MTVETVTGKKLDGDLFCNYLRNLVNQLFKILPIRESEEASLVSYIASLQSELIGCQRLISVLHDDSMFLSMISILQFLIDHPDSSVKVFKREVFKTISLCNKLKAKYIDLLDLKEA